MPHPELTNGKRRWTKLTPNEWHRLRQEFETAPDRPTHLILAQRYSVGESTVVKRAWKEKWQRQDTLALKTIRKVQEQNDQIIAQTTKNVADQLTKNLAASLQPWLEKEKAKHIKSQVLRSRSALKRIDRLATVPDSFTPKNESFIAKAAETWDTVARRNLGLTDGSVPAGSLSLSILTNHAAVQVKTAATDK